MTNKLDHLIEQLRTLYDAEEQLMRALPPFSSCAQSDQLTTILADHLEETREHVRRLRQVFHLLRAPIEGTTCEPMAALVRAGIDAIDEYGGCGTPLLDAALIDAARQVEHYEIAAYRRAIAQAKALGYDDLAALLGLNLKEEEVADRLLTMAAHAISRDMGNNDAGLS